MVRGPLTPHHLRKYHPCWGHGTSQAYCIILESGRLLAHVYAGTCPFLGNKVLENTIIDLNLKSESVDLAFKCASNPKIQKSSSHQPDWSVCDSATTSMLSCHHNGRYRTVNFSPLL